MTPTFALDLSPDTIRLLKRDGADWSLIGEVDFAAEDFVERLAELRAKAERHAPEGVLSEVVIPPSQILYKTIHLVGKQRRRNERQIRTALERQIEVPIDELAFDWQARGEQAHVAVVERRTLEEAEAFAFQHGFNPIAIVAWPQSGQFDRTVSFGRTELAEAIRERLGIGDEEDAAVDAPPGADPDVAAEMREEGLPLASPTPRGEGANRDDGAEDSVPRSPDAPPVAQGAVRTEANGTRPSGFRSRRGLAGSDGAEKDPPSGAEASTWPGNTTSPAAAPATEHDEVESVQALAGAEATRADDPAETHQARTAGAASSHGAGAMDAASHSREARGDLDDSPVTDEHPSGTDRAGGTGGDTEGPSRTDERKYSKTQLRITAGETAGRDAPPTFTSRRGAKGEVADKPQPTRDAPVLASRRSPPDHPAPRLAAVGQGAAGSATQAAPRISPVAYTPLPSERSGAEPAFAAIPTGVVAPLRPTPPETEEDAMTVFGARRASRRAAGRGGRVAVLAAAGCLVAVALLWLAILVRAELQGPAAELADAPGDAPVILPPADAIGATQPQTADPASSATDEGASGADGPTGEIQEDVPSASSVAGANASSDTRGSEARDPAQQTVVRSATPDDGLDAPSGAAAPADGAPADARSEGTDVSREIAAMPEPAADPDAPTAAGTPQSDDPTEPGDRTPAVAPPTADSFASAPFSTGSAPEPSGDDEPIRADRALGPATIATPRQPGSAPSLPGPLGPRGVVFALDGRGEVRPTAEGALSPRGVLVTLGVPGAVPPARGEDAALSREPRLAVLAPPNQGGPRSTEAARVEPDAGSDGIGDPGTADATPGARSTVEGGEAASRDGQAVTAGQPEEAAGETAETDPVSPPTPTERARAARASDIRPASRPRTISPRQDAIETAIRAAAESSDGAANDVGTRDDEAGRPEAAPGGTLGDTATDVEGSPSDADGAALGVGGAGSVVGGAEPQEGVGRTVTASLWPNARPESFALAARPPSATTPNITPTAVEPVPDVTPPPRTGLEPAPAEPRQPSRTSVARQATEENVLPLNRVALIGVYGSAQDRRALIRLPSGRYRKVKVGDRIDGGRISAIGADAVRYDKGGRARTLRMPQG